jgi:hypothetical protein
MSISVEEKKGLPGCDLSVGLQGSSRGEVCLVERLTLEKIEELGSEEEGLGSKEKDHDGGNTPSGSRAYWLGS